MGQAKQRQYSRRQFLLENPNCCYCGNLADTTDHCPPRTIFVGRNWPEGFEFPCCKACNQEQRLDEQVFSFVCKIRLRETTQNEQDDLIKILQALKNNQPNIYNELSFAGAVQRKKYFRRSFGNFGDQLRWTGHGCLNIGANTKLAIDRFIVKLARALYWKHVGEMHVGEVHHGYVDVLTQDKNQSYIDELVRLSPTLVIPYRSNKDVSDQFVYRFSSSKELGAINIFVQFSEQMAFHILAVSKSMADRLRASQLENPPPKSHNVRVYNKDDTNKSIQVTPLGFNPQS